MKHFQMVDRVVHDICVLICYNSEIRSGAAGSCVCLLDVDGRRRAGDREEEVLGPHPHGRDRSQAREGEVGAQGVEVPGPLQLCLKASVFLFYVYTHDPPTYRSTAR